MIHYKNTALAITLSIVIAMCGVGPTQVRAGVLLQQNNLVYLGAFRLPKGDLGGASLSYGGGYGAMGMAYNPSRNSLILGTEPVNSKKIVEISIPNIVNSNNINELQTASLLQPPVDPTQGHWNYLNDNGNPISEDDGGVRPGDYLVYNGKLYGSAWVYFDASGTNGDKSHFLASLNWASSGPSFEGMFKVGTRPIDPSLANGGFVGGYMAIIPQEWQSELGGHALTGQSTIPIISRTSLGPCAWAFNPEDLGKEDPVPATMLVGYPIEHPTLGRYEDEMHPYFNRAVGVTGVVFPTGSDTILFFGNIGIGQTGNGDSCYGHITHTKSLHNTFNSEIVVNSSTSSEIINGEVEFSVPKGLEIVPGDSFIAKPIAALNYHMAGTVESYNTDAGTLVVRSEPDYSLGKNTGVYSSWEVHISHESMGERLCYSLDQPLGEKGGSAYPYVYRVWAYDANELARVKRGETHPWDVLPYAVWDLELPFSPSLKDIAGVAYDSNNQRIFILQSGAEMVDGAPYPLIHVYKVQIGSDDESGGETSIPRVNDFALSGTTGNDLRFSWTPCNDNVVTGYKIYYGVSNQDYQNSLDVGLPDIQNSHMTASIPLSTFTPDISYHFTLVAYDAQSNEGSCSNEVTWTMPSISDGGDSEYENSVYVASVSELESAVSNLQSNTRVIINPGTYTLTRALTISGGVQHIQLTGSSTNREDVVIKGPGMSNQNYGNAGFGIVIANAQDVTIQDLTVQDFYFHDIMIKSEEGAKRPVLRNLHLKDAGEQLIKVTAAPNQTSYCDGGVVENCLIEYTDRARSGYTNGISALAVKDWIVRDNVFRNIRAPEGQLAGPAILFWQNSIDTIVERNRIINCDRGIALGLAGPTQYARDGETTYDHQGGIIRNNFIYRNQGGDVGISVNKAKDFKILNNTVILQGSFPWTIEYRFSSSSGLIANNLTDGPIQQRDGAQATLTTNLTSAQLNWFVNPSSADLHLVASATSAIDQGSALTYLTDDIDKDARTGTVDIGADEFTAGGQDTTPPGDVTNLQAVPGPAKVTFSWTNPTDNDFAGVMIRFRTDGTYPQDMNDGYAVPNGNDGKITGNPGANMSYEHNNLDPTKHYYYSFFTYDTSGNYSHTAHIDVQPLPTNHAPVISSFTVSPTSINNPYETATFTASATDEDGDTLSYEINFGDGSSASGATVTHAYTAAGQYTVTLTVSDGNGGISTKQLTVTVNDLPPAAPTGVSVQ